MTPNSEVLRIFVVGSKQYRPTEEEVSDVKKKLLNAIKNQTHVTLGIPNLSYSIPIKDLSQIIFQLFSDEVVSSPNEIKAFEKTLTNVLKDKDGEKLLVWQWPLTITQVKD